MPKLWSETIEAHRREVRETILATTAGLAAEQGLLNVTMSQIAEHTGIGRATLYKYYASVEEILRTWHDDRINSHLEQLREIAERDQPPFQRLASVLDAYAQMQRHRTNHGTQRHGGELAAFLHRDDQLAPAERQLSELVGALLSDAAAHGEVRADVSTGELADYCLHALNAAAASGSNEAAQRLVALVLDGLRPTR